MVCTENRYFTHQTFNLASKKDSKIVNVHLMVCERHATSHSFVLRLCISVFDFRKETSHHMPAVINVNRLSR